MIKEAYVSLDTAKILKEKGFNIPTYSYYDSDGDTIINKKYDGYWELSKISNEELNNGWSRPTHQLVVAWLREIHHIIINVFACEHPNGNMWEVDIAKHDDDFSLISVDKIYDYENYNYAMEVGIFNALIRIKNETNKTKS